MTFSQLEQNALRVADDLNSGNAFDAAAVLRQEMYFDSLEFNTFLHEVNRLSSPAAFEVAVATLMNAQDRPGLSAKEIALLSRKAENPFVGAGCGIMDQFMSALAEDDSALLIDCRSLEYPAAKLNLGKQDVSIVISNSGVPRGLVETEYNARRKQ